MIASLLNIPLIFYGHTCYSLRLALFLSKSMTIYALTPQLLDGYSMVTRSKTALKKLDPSNTTLANNMPAK